MWIKLSDCGKQLNIFTRLRENEGNHYNVYHITGIEFDQYKLKLLSNDKKPVLEKLEQVLSCSQLINYGFEIEQPPPANN